jgi:hypothetical protein
MPSISFSRQWLVSDKPIVRVETHPPRNPEMKRDSPFVVVDFDDDEGGGDVFLVLDIDEAESMARLILDAVMDARMGRFTEDAAK